MTDESDFDATVRMAWDKLHKIYAAALQGLPMPLPVPIGLMRVILTDLEQKHIHRLELEAECASLRLSLARALSRVEALQGSSAEGDCR